MAAFHSSQGAVVQISMSYLEVYNEKIFDLLVSKSAKPAGLNIRQDFGHNMSVHGLSEVSCMESTGMDTCQCACVRAYMRVCMRAREGERERERESHLQS